MGIDFKEITWYEDWFNADQFGFNLITPRADVEDVIINSFIDPCIKDKDFRKYDPLYNVIPELMSVNASFL